MCLAKSSDLPAKSPVRMTDYEILGIFLDAGNFYRCRLQILGDLSGKYFGWNGKSPRSSAEVATLDHSYKIGVP